MTNEILKPDMKKAISLKVGEWYNSLTAEDIDNLPNAVRRMLAEIDEFDFECSLKVFQASYDYTVDLLHKKMQRDKMASAYNLFSCDNCEKLMTLKDMDNSNDGYKCPLCGYDQFTLVEGMEDKERKAIN